jgi:hypothetical protein
MQQNTYPKCMEQLKIHINQCLYTNTYPKCINVLSTVSINYYALDIH